MVSLLHYVQISIALLGTWFPKSYKIVQLVKYWVGSSCLQLAKLDIKQAYRMVPIHPTDRLLLAMKWRGKTFIDKALPFGLRSAPLIFTSIADALQLP